MSIRTCKFCGWQYPIDHKGRYCKICGQPFDEVWCVSCKQLKPATKFDVARIVCRKCRRPLKNGYRRVHVQKLDDMHQEWLDKVRRVPKDYPTLTEEQWLDACAYFDGCARCGNKEIDARGFLISPKLGGRYCDWNVIPLCEKCANTWDLELSIFRHAEHRDHVTRANIYRECLKNIVEYLGGKLNEAINDN